MKNNWNLSTFIGLSYTDKILYCNSIMSNTSTNDDYYSFDLPDKLILYIARNKDGIEFIRKKAKTDYLIDYDVVGNTWIIVENEINLSEDMVEAGAIRKNASYFIKLCKDDSSEWKKIPGWNDIQNVNVSNRYNQESIYIPVIGNDVFKVRVSAHDKNKDYTSDVNVYITSNKKDEKAVMDGYKELKKYNNLIPKLIPILKSSITHSFCVKYIRNYDGKPKTIMTMLQAIKLPSYVKNFKCFKTILKDRCEQAIQIEPSLKEKYMTMGISYYIPSENNQVVI